MMRKVSSDGPNVVVVWNVVVVVAILRSSP